ncbi:putative diheme cytochrome c-553 [Pantoea sp. AS-PWVM4]|uniref:c-type cytochrome n=1 Tax=Pantoea sp. AS-PWVM4 TaxID=1332069 RepID=UPI0003AC6927|nr:cytochrome c [Pantoea sp. AS-PWVM4]ERK16263.1 putative diheme cytochrome c-553 [Pantoea sp. AS-PWVM4]
MMRLSLRASLLMAPLAGLFFCSASFAAGAPQDLIRQGEYLSKASDCEVCHTAPGGTTFAGGLAFKTPFGVIYSSNITPDKSTGIGRWTEQQFSNALKHGIRADGKNLYPAMPYTSYSKLTDADIHAMYAYFMSIQGVNHNPPENEMGFPYNQRLALKGWNLINFHYKPFEDDPQQSAEWNRGKYVATALGHCEECHTPRNLAMGLSNKAYAGAMVDGWEAFNISSDKVSGIGNWSHDDLMQYLRTGALPGKATTGGGMADVISHSLRFLTPEDMSALATYIKSVPAQQTSSRNRSAAGQDAQSNITQDVRGMPIDDASPSGAVLYNGNCASCHGTAGQGIGENRYYPSLSQNSVVGSDKPNNLVQVILHGIDRENGAGDHIVMPGFGDNLTDAQIATLTNYVRNQYGNGGDNVDGAAVKTLRDNNVTVIPGYLLIAGGGVGALIVIALVVYFRRRGKLRQIS